MEGQKQLRILIVADGQSPHTQNWIRMVVAMGHEVHLASTFPCADHGLPVKSLHLVPLDFSAKVRAQEKAAVMGTGTSTKKSAISRLRGTPIWKALAELRNRSMAIAILLQKKKLAAVVKEVEPDIVHALRITFEGVLAAQAMEGSKVPLIGSVWGNDFTLQAAGNPVTAKLVRRALKRLDALHPDCYKDLRIGREEYGFDPNKPAIVLPGNGGVNADLFTESAAPKADVLTVVNPRGLKSYIRVDTFFESIPLILKELPGTKFKMSSAKGKSAAEAWVSRLGLEDSVELLDSVPHGEMAKLFASSHVVASPSEHDGTPNTLLEAMACGAFPVAGNIESVREWVTDGENGFLFDPGSPEEMAAGVIRALKDVELRTRAASISRESILARAEIGKVSELAREFYQTVFDYGKLNR